MTRLKGKQRDTYFLLLEVLVGRQHLDKQQTVWRFQNKRFIKLQP